MLVTLAWLVFGTIVGLAVTFLAGRLLGARRGWLSLVVSGVAGWTAAVVVAGLVTDWEGRTFAMVAIAVVLGTLFAMVFAVLLDLVAPIGSLARGEAAGLVTITNPVAGARAKIDPFRRYREVIGIARRNGVAVRSGSRQSLPAGVRRTLEEAGGIFVKLGQVASTRADVLPPEWCEELTSLRSAAEPQPESAMRPHITEQLGAAPEEVFESFEWQPMASASIAQVYRARLAGVGEVVVKVQRPNLDDVMARDSQAVMQLARLIERRTPFGITMHPVDLAGDFLDGVREELDFTIERDNAKELALAVGATSGVRLPTVHAELSGERILVEEFVHAPNIGQLNRLVGFDIEAIADRLAESFMHQIFDVGLYHADPHPGNILVEPDGTIVLIDLGSVGRLAPGQRAAVMEMMAGASIGSATQVRQALSQIVIIDRDVDVRVLDADIEMLLARHIRSGAGIGSAAFQDLATLVGQHGIRLPRWFGTLTRTLVTLEGTLSSVRPGFSLVDAGRRHAEQRGLAQPSAQDLRSLIEEEAMLQLPRLRRLPEQVDELVSQAVSGRLSARLSVFANPRDQQVVTRLVDRVVLAIIASAAGIGSVVLVASDSGPVLRDDLLLNELLGYVGLTAAAVLALRVVAGVIRDGST
jgi:ubiquinone biosynthesis protein